MRNLSIMKFWTAVILISGATASAPAWAATVNCNNNSGDAAAIQNAINAGGTATITGTCAIGMSTINVNNAVTITGGAKFVATASFNNWTFLENVDNVTFNNLIFDNAGVKLTAANDSVKRTSVNFTHCTFQNFTAMPNSTKFSAIDVVPIWVNSVFTNNTLTNIWYTGYPNTGSGPDHGYWSAHNGDTYVMHGLEWFGGLDGTKIEYNTCYAISGNCFKGFDQGLSSKTIGYQVTSANAPSVSYNTGTQIHRMGIEWQNQAGNCVGGCGGFGYGPNGNIPVYALTLVRGNNFHTIAYVYNNSFCMSLPVVTVTSQFINNNCDRDVIGNPLQPGDIYGYGIEMQPGTGCCGNDNAPGGLTVSGNVIQADKSVVCSNGGSSCGWEASILGYGQQSGKTQVFDNNYVCGPDSLSTTIPNGGGNLQEYNFINSNGCSNKGSAEYTSNISATVFTSANNRSFLSGGNGAWTLGVISNLSIRNVQFSVGGSLVKTQEIQDVSTTFQNDLTWRYSVTFNTSNYGQGTHTITATATDVSGATKSASQTFTVGNVAAANPCDLNGDGSVTVADVQLEVNKVLGVTTPCGTADINEDGQCTVADVQRLVNAVLEGGVCKVGP